MMRDGNLLSNGELLMEAEAAEFEVFVTCDQNIFHQQDRARRQIALIVLGTNRLSLL